MINKPSRIAFLTSEFISENKSGGGLGNYLNRITQALKQLGHIPEVFVVSPAKPSVIDFNGVRIQRVPKIQNFPIRLFSYTTNKLRLVQGAPWGGPANYLTFAYSLSCAFKERHAEKPFDFVQSTNCHSSGYFLPKLSNCPHLVRLSSKRDLWFHTDGRVSRRGTRWMWQLERACVRKADIAYAPSQFVVERCRQDGWRANMSVLRPPVFIESEPSSELPSYLPERYLIHFGQIGKRKGSLDLAAALCRVWEEEPNFKMIWAGTPIKEGEYERCHKMWGEKAVNVLWLGAIEKPTLYAILEQSEAAVLPSIVDNLPNTVIESLLFGIPVIGFRGGSVDELVETEVNGKLVEMGNSKALADAMLKVWRQEMLWNRGNLPLSSIFKELEPSFAAKSLVQLAIGSYKEK